MKEQAKIIGMTLGINGQENRLAIRFLEGKGYLVSITPTTPYHNPGIHYQGERHAGLEEIKKVLEHREKTGK